VALRWQVDLRIISGSFNAPTTPARDLWHGRIHAADGLSGEEEAWCRIAEHEPLARKPAVAFDRSAPGLGLGRFFGDPGGLAIFRGLADAAFRCLLRSGLVTFEDPVYVPKRDCSTYWLDVVYRMAEQAGDTGGALLARERAIHSPGVLWTGAATQGFNIRFAFLERDVFTSSVAAIEVILRDGLKVDNPPTAAQDPLLPTETLLPRWDDDNRTLYLGDKPIKVYGRHPAENQTALLNAFQAQGWPTTIPTPFQGARKLNSTIAALNSSLRATRLRFRGDGTGEGVRWQIEDL
jgi:hypothetical protein